MPRVKPKDRYLKVDGTTHAMFKNISMWVSYCYAETRFPRAFSWSHKGPATCLECISADPKERADEPGGHSMTYESWNYTPSDIKRYPGLDGGGNGWRENVRAKRPFGRLREVIASTLLYKGAQVPWNVNDYALFMRKTLKATTIGTSRIFR